MGRVERKNLDSPDEVIEYGSTGTAQVVMVGDTYLVRSVLEPGWSWDEAIGPTVSSTSCPLYHREFVVSGQIRYLMDDGSETVGSTGDYLVIEPGHRAWVVSSEPCVLLDWE